MLVIYLLFFLICEIATSRFASEAARLFVQIFLSLLCVILLLTEGNIEALFFLKSNKYDLYIVAFSLIAFGAIKLYGVIANDNRESYELKLPLFVLTSVAVPILFFKMIFLLILFSVSIERRSCGSISISCLNTFCVFTAFLTLLDLPSYPNINIFIYALFLLFTLQLKSLPHYIVASSLIIGALALPLWMVWTGLIVLFIRLFIFLLINNKIIDFNKLNLSLLMNFERVINNLRFQKEKNINFPLLKTTELKRQTSSMLVVNRKNMTLLELIMLWSILFFLSVVMGGYF